MSARPQTRMPGGMPAEASAPPLRLVRSFATGDETGIATGDETNGSRGGRPRKHVDAAAKQRAYRANNEGVVTWRLGDVATKVADIAREADIPANELAHQMLKYALSNRDWRTQPMFGKPLPTAARRAKT